MTKGQVGHSRLRARYKWVNNNQNLAIVWIEFIQDLAQLSGLTSTAQYNSGL